MFDIKIKEITESAHPNDGSFLQTPFWCEFKARHGWKYRRFLLETDTFLPDDQKQDHCDHDGASEADNCGCGTNTGSSGECCSTGGEAAAHMGQSVSPAKKGGPVKTEIAVLTRTFKKLFTIAYIPLFPGLPYKCTDKALLEKALSDDGDCETFIPEEIVTPETQ